MIKKLRQLISRHWLLIIIVILAILVRTYRINYPLLDWHSWRQADTASVTLEFVRHGIDILKPTYHDVSSIPSGLDNPSGYRMVEFPFLNALIALILKAIPALPLVATSRFISLLFSIGTLLTIFAFAYSYSCKRTAYLSAITFALLPYSIYYSRAILPEPALIFFSTLSIYTFWKWSKSKKLYWYVLSLVSLALSFLLKPIVVFLAPVYLVLTFQAFGKRFWKQLPLYIYPVLAVIPFLLWRNWIAHFPEGIPASDWLLNGNGIRLRPAWFRWLGYERLTKLILGYAGLIFLPFSFLDRRKDTWLYLSWWLGILAYFVVIATGNVQHDYYQVFLLPILSLTIGKGMAVLYNKSSTILGRYLPKFKIYSHIVAFILVFVTFNLMLVLSWLQVSGYFNVNHSEYVDVGKVVAAKTPDDALIIAPAMGDTAFLFQTQRRGWPIGGDIHEKISRGAQYYVTTSYDDEARELESKYFILEKTDEYLIIDLTKGRAE